MFGCSHGAPGRVAIREIDSVTERPLAVRGGELIEL
jgi:hypothetical protein